MKNDIENYLKKEKINLLDDFDEGTLNETITLVYQCCAGGEMTSDVGECFLFPDNSKLHDECTNVVLNLLKEKSVGAYKCFKSHLRDTFEKTSKKELLKWASEEDHFLFDAQNKVFLRIKQGRKTQSNDIVEVFRADKEKATKDYNFENYDRIVKINNRTFALIKDSGFVLELKAIGTIKIEPDNFFN